MVPLYFSEILTLRHQARTPGRSSVPRSPNKQSSDSVNGLIKKKTTTVLLLHIFILRFILSSFHSDQLSLPQLPSPGGGGGEGEEEGGDYSLSALHSGWL